MLYVELLARTHYSFLRGASSPQEMVEQAAKLGLHGIGISDLNGVYGMPKAYLAWQGHSRLKFIVGAELTLEAHPSVHLIAMNREGYGLMCRLLSASHAGKPKGEAALKWSELEALCERFPQALEGLIAIPRFSEDASLSFYRGLKFFFQNRIYLPLFRALDGFDGERTAKALQISRELEIPIVATNQPFYHEPERRHLQDVLTCIRETVTLQTAGFRLFSNSDRYLKSPDEMRELFKDMPEALERTVEIASRCTFSPSELRYTYPSEWIPKGETAQSHLITLTWRGAASRYPQGVPEKIKVQIEKELKLIEQLKFPDYFLTIWDIVEYARGRQILCQGRGSAANSAVCYCLGITEINPNELNLLFERFISAERNEPPDIDVDFEHERREEVIQYIYEKYGRDRAGMVAAVIMYRSRSAKREVNKVFGHDPEMERGKDSRVDRFAKEILDFPRHLSIHSGGFTLSAHPIIETVPIEPARMEGRTIVQWDKNDLDVMGLLKVDVLALGMLTAIRKALDLVKPKKELTLATIPQGDKETYDMICAGDTVGVFQIESRAQIGMLRRLRPRSFYDLVIEVAIVRPGPIVGEMVHPYLKRRDGIEAVTYPHPELKAILSRTLGVPLFQEQVMQMAISLAGFTPGEADELRRAIAAWRSSGSVEKMGKRLMEGLLKAGIAQEYVERIFKQIQGFAEYGFPESHSASFALLAYASSYLKKHYPAEFACALVNSQPMGFYSTHTILDEAKRVGVPIYPVDPQLSDWDCVLEGKGIRVGFRVVNGLGEAAARKIIEERGTQRFQSLSDFLWRTSPFIATKIFETLAMGGAFECFGHNQRDALWQILADCMLYRGEQGSAAKLSQLSLFDGSTSSPQKVFGELREYEAIESDYRSYGMSVKGHPMQALRKLPELKIPPVTTGSLRRKPAQGRSVRLGGLIIVRQRPPTAKGTVFATLEDEEGFLDLVLHAKVFEKYESTFSSEPFLLVEGQMQYQSGSFSMLVKRVSAIEVRKWRLTSRDFH